MMRKFIFGACFAVVFFVFIPFFSFVNAEITIDNNNASASEISAPIFYKARVEKILDFGEKKAYGLIIPHQNLVLSVLDGDMEGEKITLNHGTEYVIDKAQLVNVGDIVLLRKLIKIDGTFLFQISDRYRLEKIIPLIIIFFLAILMLSGLQGLGSILGMIISLGVIIKYIVPQILEGKDPFFVSIVGCLLIMVTTIYLAHGFSKKTTIALFSTFVALLFTSLLSVLFVQFTNLTGLGNDEASSLRIGLTSGINFKGLLLGGILIGTLGVLDDITTGLSVSIFELKKANPKYSFGELFRSGLIIGKEHIASLVNTLVLAYAGASLPIFITIVLNPSHYPMSVILNDGLLIEEAVRTLVGSIGLVSAVPLTTFFASFYISKFEQKNLSQIVEND